MEFINLRTKKSTGSFVNPFLSRTLLTIWCVSWQHLCLGWCFFFFFMFLGCYKLSTNWFAFIMLFRGVSNSIRTKPKPKEGTKGIPMKPQLAAQSENGSNQTIKQIETLSRWLWHVFWNPGFQIPTPPYSLTRRANNLHLQPGLRVNICVVSAISAKEMGFPVEYCSHTWVKQFCASIEL